MPDFQTKFILLATAQFSNPIYFASLFFSNPIYFVTANIDNAFFGNAPIKILCISTEA